MNWLIAVKQFTNYSEFGGFAIVQIEELLDEPSWIQDNLSIRQCVYFVPSAKDPQTCDCGSKLRDHPEQTLPVSQETRVAGTWNANQHTKEEPNNTFGEIAFTMQERFAKVRKLNELLKDVSSDSDTVNGQWHIRLTVC